MKSVFVLTIISYDPSSDEMENVEVSVHKDKLSAETAMKQHSYQIYKDEDGDKSFDEFEMIYWSSYGYNIEPKTIM